jgi:hypothetical protein
MDKCACGARLKHFWIWRDDGNVAHASAFEPAIQSEARLLAATARDAIRALQAPQPPKHDVLSSPSGPAWQGQCRERVPLSQ